MSIISTPITVDSLVIRAWKTDPSVQYEIGQVVEVKENNGQHPTHGDVTVQWLGGYYTNELYQELHHIEVSLETYIPRPPSYRGKR